MSLTELQDAKEQVRQAIDIVDLVGNYVTLRRQGRNYVALCPWHDDSRPSLQVNPERQSFKCWVCDIGGDIFSFLMRMEGLEFREALEMLAERGGIELKPSRQEQQPSEYDRSNLLKVMAWAEQQYADCLAKDPSAEPARCYLAERGINDQSIQKFHLGFVPSSWDWLLKRATQVGFSPAVLERVGLVSPRQTSEGYYDRFRGRLIFSIRDVRSRPIAFGGRVLPGVGDSDPDRPEAKYINSPETPLFNKSQQLYALDLARTGAGNDAGLVVMEGYTDVIMAHQHGINNAVAVLGTALGEHHVSLVRRFTDSITLVLDGDTAGQRRTMQILDDLLALFIAHEIDLRILTLPEGADPCDVIAAQGSDAFRQLLSASVEALDHKISAVTNGLESAPGTHRASQAIEEILSTLARVLPQKLGAVSAAFLREQQVLARLGRAFGVSEEVLRTRLAAQRREQRTKNRTPVATDQNPQATTHVPTLKLKPWERELLELLVHQPEVLPRIAEALAPEDIASEACRSAYETALELMHAGQIPTFEQLMLATDEPGYKSLLVDCDEQGRDKLASDTDQRVRDLLEHIAQEKQTARHESQLAELKQHRLDPQHEEEVLAELYQDLKRRQTGSAPTDG